jgi:hypothetical protein
MSPLSVSPLRRAARTALTGALALLLPVSAWAADIRVEAKLIWGTNDDKYSNPKHQRVDGPTSERLSKIFKWKNYFVVNQQTSLIPSRSTKRLQMSKPCALDITEMEADRVEITLFGQGKPLNKMVKPLKKGGETIIIGGEDKNDCAWFIMISQLE